eukprot:SAG11_NODE_1435_length_4914_cov_10.282866_2_plen_39_part_00
MHSKDVTVTIRIFIRSYAAVLYPGIVFFFFLDILASSH